MSATYPHPLICGCTIERPCFEHAPKDSCARLVMIPAPDGKRTETDPNLEHCEICKKALPLQWWKETRASGRVVTYPTPAASVVTATYETHGRPAHGDCRKGLKT
jgi:hypothetical protein